jgi:hypothetical protein
MSIQRNFSLDPRVTCAACGCRYHRGKARCPTCASTLRTGPTAVAPTVPTRDANVIDVECAEGILGDGNYFTPIHELSDVTAR